MAACCNSSSLILQKTASINVVAFLVLDFITAILTIAGNSIFMLTLIKNKVLHTPSNMLLAALCFSDLLVGYVLHPMYLSFFFKLEVQCIYDFPHRQLAFTVANICIGMSFLFGVIVSLDRYVAICHPYRYHASASCKTHICIAILAGMTLVTVATLSHLISWQSFLARFTIAFLVTGIVLILFSYHKIYCVIKRHNNSVHTLGTIGGAVCTEQRREGERRRHEQNRARMIMIILVCQFVSFFPYVGLMAYLMAMSRFFLETSFEFILDIWVNFFLLANSLINPIIYCLKCKTIKDSALKLLFGNRNSESQCTNSRHNEMK